MLYWSEKLGSGTSVAIDGTLTQTFTVYTHASIVSQIKPSAPKEQHHQREVS